ncbi:MAG: tRNA 2-thiouridine(34) synthase MnmA [Candidatus Saganbacteria bacterium]|nr:tRNA 2-thiouridine(34) synthase MnmA [Candidatus Saganbacteria bacterium]
MSNFIKNRQKVALAMSGGVDSSTAAALLKEQGHEVIGVTMIVWPGKDQAAREAKKVADKLGIEHHVFDLSDEFRQKVVDVFINEYKQGRTPNPCIRCNREIKFDLLWQEAKELGAEKLATGHYARIMQNEESCLPAGRCGMKNEGHVIYKLLKGKDPKKDQSYFLYVLDQARLSRTLFPLGELTKEEIRKKAKELGLSVHDKAESQEICFIDHDDYGAFLRLQCPEAVRSGDIVDQQGKVVGQHEGICFYTLGQRKGIGHYQGRPKYVVRLDPQKNQVVIGDQADVMGTELAAEEINYISGSIPEGDLAVMAKIRYNSPEAAAMLVPAPSTQHLEPACPAGRPRARLIFKESQLAITPGQSMVFYKGDEVIGGGLISSKDK